VVSSFEKNRRTYITVQRILSESNERSDMVDHDLSEVTEQMTFAVKPCTSKFVPAPCPSFARCYGHAILSASILPVQQNKSPTIDSAPSWRKLSKPPSMFVG
jgi:hypothetical protein